MTAQRADKAHERLLEGMVERTPGCKGIDAFTADRLTRDDIAALKPICTACDLRLLCAAYADAARPRVGFWAGRYYGPKNRSGEKAA
ncbi:transcription factor WhiB [Microbacterium sp. SLBN-154]|uniref:WhiB family transcriptional regulator n=1 Tax=Microbacterium sp. SLBN-154 TaxID=2768458 RepID=UPI001154740B|nr:WhiB family transcriptional regulator [Microbacterium sp. SLBN-154]TQK19109.1 transcription factor WhiB [Microbacterium sp. SLBN-154]